MSMTPKVINLTFFTANTSNGKFLDQTVTYYTSISPMYKYQHRSLGRKYYEQSNPAYRQAGTSAIPK